MHTKPATLPPKKKSNPAKHRVFLVDDHPMTREGLAAIINRQPDLEVSGDASNAAEAMSALPHAKPDLIVTDLTMPDGSGLELIKKVHAILPATPVLVLSMHDELLYAERALHAGARGYLMKDAGAEKVLEAIRLVLAGQVYVSPQMNRRLLDSVAGPAADASPIGSLSPREFEVFQLIGKGLSTKEVATQLSLSPKTIEAHRANIREKLQLNDSLSLMYYATRWVESQETTLPALSKCPGPECCTKIPGARNPGRTENGSANHRGRRS